MVDYQEIVIELASEFHEAWRKTRLKINQDGSPYFEARWKETNDPDMDLEIQNGVLSGKQYRINPQTGRPEFDIANLTFDKLSKKWQEENFLSAKVCLETASKGLIPIASNVHDEWLRRNPYAKNDPDVGVFFEELSLTEQLKDVVLVAAAVDKLAKIMKQEPEVGLFQIVNAAKEFDKKHSPKTAAKKSM